MAYKFGATVSSSNATEITFGDGTLWVVNEPGNSVTRIDPVTLTVTATITVAGARTVVFAFGYCFVGSSGSFGIISKIDPATNTVVGTVNTSGSIIGLTFDANYLIYTLVVLFTGFPPGYIVSIDPTTLTGVGTGVGAGVGTAGGAGAGSMWLADATGIIQRFNPTTSALQATITLPAGSYATGLTFAFGSIWAGVFLTSSPFSSVERIDPATNAVIPAAMDFGSGVSSLYFATQTTALWVTDLSGSVRRIDPTTNSFTDTLATPLSQSPRGMGVDATNSVWVSSASIISRIDLAGGIFTDGASHL
jgi:YVTN family beta-propeller protein